jgi:peptide/nickel transport system substrate-binding protein/oligopeptide transport system substrate-binding protein
MRRDDYHDETAKVDGIIYRIIPEDLTAVTEFELGNLDVLTIPASEYARIQNDEKMKHLISSQKGLNTYYIGFNCSRPPFNRKIVRKAVSMAIDRQKILETIFESRGRLASGPVPDTLRNWNQPTPYKYDQAKARSLLSAENIQEKEIFFYITADQEIVDIAEIIQWYLQKVGLRVTIRQLEWSAFKEATTRGEADMFYLSWWADYSDPENFLFPLFHSSNFGSPGNRTQYSNPIVDSLIEKGQNVLDMKSRESYYMKAEEIIVDDAPWVFLWHRNEYVVRNPWVRNYKTYPIYSMDKGTEIRIETFNTEYDR